MRGLLVKDLKLLKMQNKFFIIMLVLMGVFTMLDYNLSIIVSYPTFMCTFVVISTISYDEFNHGTTFLMTLPISRKEYVQGKFILGIGITFSVWLMTTLFCTLLQMFNTPHFDVMTWIMTCGVLLCVTLIFLAVVLPIQLKYGSEKVRIAMVLAMGGVIAIAFLLVKGLSFFNIDFIQIINSFDPLQITLFGIVALVITIFISYMFSYKIMENKEF